ncbi:flagellar hook-associated protein FlgK [Rhodoferax koreense]|uniref:Flagellar hook-associated protein 1 n=1 Tax=Rhodoferax koreensis TaxID=1842727 RepID=A0A1P8JS76_9BURK|nr:flagellar hook-associated protein FlgK [Rhodoferax koreense]APW36612.1 flagellar hook-associated protein FlgK [Rhodoferax koreense]
MSGLLNLGTRALLANQAALSTAGHNIANVNTVGYSRQSVVLEATPGQFSGGGYIGKGVDIVTVQRTYNQFLTRQAALTQAIQAGDTARSDKLTQLQDIFQSGKTGLGAAVNDMLNAFSDVSSAPTDLTARNVVLTRANELTARFRSTSNQLDEIKSGVTQQLQQATANINSLTSRIAALNEQIARATGTGQAPNDLLDQRDQLINELNKSAQTTTAAASDGTLSVFIGNQAVVLGSSASSVKLVADDYGVPDRKLAVQLGNTTNVLDENTIGGGEVAGLLRFQNNDLVEAGNLLGRMALAITNQVNDQHKLGLDLDGQQGGNLFTPLALADGKPQALNSVTHLPITATVGVTVKDATKMVASDYELRMTGAGTGSIVRLSDGQTTAVTSVPVDIDGLTFTVGAGAANGDTFLIQPFANAASGMNTAIASARDLAAASVIEPQIGTANKGNVAVVSLAAKPAGFVMPPAGGVTLDFTAGSPPTFTLTGNASAPVDTATGNAIAGPPYTYTSGQTITVDGWQLKLQGTPATGDSIKVQDATPTNGGTGYFNLNAGNSDALMGLRDVATFDGANMADGYAGLIAQIGVRTQSAQYASSVSQAIAANAESDRTAVTGVNLDEEAAKLIQYQQAYQASSKMIQIAQTIFDTLIQNMAR